MDNKKKVYLEAIAKLLDEYSGDEEESYTHVECSITFVDDIGISDVWCYTSGEFEKPFNY